MSPNPKQSQENHKNQTNATLCPPPLKLNRDSHFIKKPPPSTSWSPPSAASSSSSPSPSTTATVQPAKPRHPVIIYTHSPKVIQTQPKDFMALVQKLTGMSRSGDEVEPNANAENTENKIAKVNNINNSTNNNNHISIDNNNNNNGVVNVSDHINNQSSSLSVITTDDHRDLQVPVTPCSYVGVAPPPPPPPQIFDSPVNHPYFTLTPNLTDHFLRTNQPFYNYNASPDPLFFSPDMRSSVSSSSSSGLEALNEFGGLNEFRDFNP